MLESLPPGYQPVSVWELRNLGSEPLTPAHRSPSFPETSGDQPIDVTDDEHVAGRPSKRARLEAKESGKSVTLTRTWTGQTSDTMPTPILLPEAASLGTLPLAGGSLPWTQGGRRRMSDLELPLSRADPRLTVSSLLTASGDMFAVGVAASRERHGSSGNYGVDRGLPDLDVGRNQDANALESPTVQAIPVVLENREHSYGCVVAGQSSEDRVGSGGYYEEPVVIHIPRRLEPLPAKLLENPMNLLVWRPLLWGL